jgi:DNA-directed RNA polymerase specialized sigma24 family protein
VLPLREGAVSGRVRNGEGWLELIDGDPTFDAVAERAEPEPLRHIDLSGLTPKQRFVISRAWGLLDGKEYSYREIAEAMSVHFTTVQEHYRAAMERLSREHPYS